MRQKFEIELKVHGIGDVIQLHARTTLYNANRAFNALRVYLHGSAMFGAVDLYVKSKDTRYKINSAKIKGADNGL